MTVRRGTAMASAARRDRDTAPARRARCVVLWESKETAEAAEDTLGERRGQMASGVGLTVESADLYEALVVEMEGARV
jgi:hypothetical protein